MANKPDALWVGIDCDKQTRQPTVYSVGVGEKPADVTYEIPPDRRPPPGDREMSVPPEFLSRLDQRLKEQMERQQGPVEVVIKTNENLKDGYYLSLLLELQKRPKVVVKTFDGVREKK
jgi:hypothetical protein